MGEKGTDNLEFLERRLDHQSPVHPDFLSNVYTYT